MCRLSYGLQRHYESWSGNRAEVTRLFRVCRCRLRTEMEFFGPQVIRRITAAQGMLLLNTLERGKGGQEECICSTIAGGRRRLISGRTRVFFFSARSTRKRSIISSSAFANERASSNSPAKSALVRQRFAASCSKNLAPR